MKTKQIKGITFQYDNEDFDSYIDETVINYGIAKKLGDKKMIEIYEKRMLMLSLAEINGIDNVIWS